MTSDEFADTATPGAAPSRILLGEIGSPHGLRGDVYIKTFTDNPADIVAYGPLTSEDGARTYELSHIRVRERGVIARIVGREGRSAVEALRGERLFILRNQLPPPGEDTYYYADLVGLCAVDPEGRPLGTVKSVQNYGAGDLIEIAVSGSGRTELVPFTKAFVRSIDLAARRAVIVLPAGGKDG